MNVDELLHFKPKMAPKRPLLLSDSDSEDYIDDPNDSYEMRAAKKRRAQQATERRKEEKRRLRAEAEMEEEKKEINHKKNSFTSKVTNSSEIRYIEEELETQEEEKSLTTTSMKKLILSFEKKTLKNQELRIKFPDQPEKFMDSEVDLHEAIVELKVIATTPELYPLLVDLQSVSTLLGLLSHENSDISVSILELLQELTDIDTLQESEEGSKALVDSLLSNQIPPLLVQNLERLHEKNKEESEGIHNTLSIIENLIEYRSEFSSEIISAGLFSFLLSKCKARVEFDSNKLYASEILSILLQSDESIPVIFGEVSGAMDSLLQQLAYYKRHEPSTSEEHEMLENLFDSLSTLLSSPLSAPANRLRFLKGEGLQLMNLMLREKKTSRNGALKVLSHALNGVLGQGLCHKFIEVLGLKTIFPLFMKTPGKKKRKGVTAEEHEERTISIIASLLRNVQEGSLERKRLLDKFLENDFEKVERLLELHFKYSDRIIRKEKSFKEKGGSIKSMYDDEELYSQRLDFGLFTLQQTDFIILDISNSLIECKKRVCQILSQRNGNISLLKDTVREYACNLGGEESKDDESRSFREKTTFKQHLFLLVNTF